MSRACWRKVLNDNCNRRKHAAAAFADLSRRLLRTAGMADRPQESRRPISAARARQRAVAHSARISRLRRRTTPRCSRSAIRSAPVSTSSPMVRCAAKAIPTALPPRSKASTSTIPAPRSIARGHPNPVPRVAGKVRRKHPVEVEDVKFLRANTDTHDQDHGARPVHHVAAGAERFLQGRGRDGARLCGGRQCRDQGPVRRRRRHRADRRALYAGAARKGAAVRVEGVQRRARRRERHDRGSHLLRLCRDHPRAAGRLFVPAGVREFGGAADLDRDCAVEARLQRAGETAVEDDCPRRASTSPT